MSDEPRDAVDEHFREGVEHLQAAALELIQAARSFLDVAEDVVKDPGAVMDLVAVLALQAQAATRARPSSRKDDGGDGRVERIRVL